ncbi:MAG: GTPase HflX [Anaerolineales bacterium]|nr:GTPase HflX [Anaerolineales bacterium]
MMGKVAIPTTLPQERAFLVGLAIKNQPGLLSIDDSLLELALLAETAGLGVVGQAHQTLEHPNPKTYLGSGKIREIKALVEDLVADIVLFDDELNPRHQRELEKEFGESVRIVDRTALILDIFAQHAQTREGALQVELAQYEYRLPRLTRAWTHLARQAGGGGGRSGSVGGVGLRGPGETQLEVDRREIRRRIASLKRELEKVRAHRSRHRERRKRSAMPTVALVGYTNAGKSTLLNYLTDADVYVADELFATLDPTTRRVISSKGHPLLFTDTVGFIQKLPTALIAAFRATLEEIHEADILLHVVDITHANAASQAEAVQATLEEIQISGIPMITALNKIDRLLDQEHAFEQVDSFERAVPISALTGDGVDTLLAVIEREMFEDLLEVTVELPYKEGRLISMFHDHGEVADISYDRESVVINGKLPQRLEIEFRPYLVLDTIVSSGEEPIEEIE